MQSSANGMHYRGDCLYWLPLQVSCTICSTCWLQRCHWQCCRARQLRVLGFGWRPAFVLQLTSFMARAPQIRSAPCLHSNFVAGMHATTHARSDWLREQIKMKASKLQALCARHGLQTDSRRLVVQQHHARAAPGWTLRVNEVTPECSTSS